MNDKTEPQATDASPSMFDGSYSAEEQALPPDEINIPPEHPLKDFAGLFIAGLAIVSVVVGLLVVLSSWLAPKIPFEFERALADRFAEQFFPSSLEDIPVSITSAARQAYIESVADKLLASASLPEGMSVDVHYVDDDTVNAFATIGGHVFIHGGLFNALDNENALAFVIAHELGHIAERHPVEAMGRGLAVVISLSALLGFSDAVIPDWLITNTANVTVMSFSRQQERAADEFALQLVQSHYGHVQGAQQFFDYIAQQHGDGVLNVEALQTHPLTDARLAGIEKFAASHGQVEQKLVPMPSDVHAPPPPVSAESAN